MIAHGLIQRAARVHALALQVCTTGTTTLAAIANGYTRASGSFLDDGFRVGMEVTPTGFTDLTPRTITAVSALSMTVSPAPVAAQTADTGRSLAVGFPQYRGWENVEFTPPTATPINPPHVEERYLPAGTQQVTIGEFGDVEGIPIYQLDVSVAQKVGMDALAAYCDALMAHFAPRQSFTTATGQVVRVRTDVGPFRSQIAVGERAGWAVCSVSFPLWVRTPNTI
jgi:hypothetical protein